jgi:hypothetical protein
MAPQLGTKRPEVSQRAMNAKLSVFVTSLLAFAVLYLVNPYTKALG